MENQSSNLHVGHYEQSVQFYQYSTVVVKTLHQYLCKGVAYVEATEADASVKIYGKKYKDRLNGLALLRIHKDNDVDRVRVLDKFDAGGSRRIEALYL